MDETLLDTISGLRALPLAWLRLPAAALRLEADRQKLEELKRHILEKIPAAGISADQPYREADLAIDYCEDIPPLPDEAVDQIVGLFKEFGAEAKVSSIHVNGWFGEYDKLTMTRLLFEEVFRENLADIKQDVIYIGDSPNDAPMFAYFPHSVGVANVLQFEGRMPCDPAWITRKEGGYGFAEMVNKLLTLKENIRQSSSNRPNQP